MTRRWQFGIGFMALVGLYFVLPGAAMAAILLDDVTAMYGSSGRTKPATLSNLAGAENVSVRQAGRGITFKFDNLDPTCLLDSSSINSQTVILTDETDAQRAHPLYTASWSRDGEGGLNLHEGSFYLDLSIVVPGYELPELTNHRLLLKAGGILFECEGDDYRLSADKEFTFATGKDTFAPTVYGVGTGASMNSGQVWWSSGEMTTGKVRYGLTASYGSVVSTGLGLDHKAQLTNLQPGKTYHYKIESTDANGNLTGQTGTFQTWSMGSVRVSRVTGHEASVTWTTSRPTDSIVEFGTSSGSFTRRAGSNDRSQKHDIRLVNLQSDTRYYFRIRATNEAGVALTQQLTFVTRDVSGGVSAETIEFPTEVVRPFDEWSRFNLKDFPDDVLTEDDSADEPSEGAVLSDVNAGESLGAGVVRYVKTGVETAEARLGWWVVWILIPLILLVVAVGLYLYYRHDLRMNNWRLELKRLEVDRGR